MDSDDAKPFDLVNPHSAADTLIICDHASRAVPVELDHLGLGPEVFEQHVAWAIGGAGVSRGLAHRLGATALLCGFSRLVIDPNRELYHEHSIRAKSDAIRVPGNENIDRAEAARRARTLYHPYHQEIERRLRAIQERHVPVLISIHTFTPQLSGDTPRRWHGAVLHGDDDRFVAPVLERFRSLFPDLVIGDNEPYTGYSHDSYSVLHHAERRGLPNVTFEIRQDLIQDQGGIDSWADILRNVLQAPLAAPELRSIWSGAREP